MNVTLLSNSYEYSLSTRALCFYAAAGGRRRSAAPAADAGDSDCSGSLVLCTLTSYTQMRAWPLTRVELLTCLAFMSENLMRTLHSMISCGIILGTLR